MIIKNLINLIFLTGISITVVSYCCYAAESTSLGPVAGLVPNSLRAYVDTKNCTAPIQSSPYVMIAGIGGTDMNLSCPADHPVMYSWKQRLGFGVGVTGGGSSWITCCAVSHKWAPAITR